MASEAGKGDGQRPGKGYQEGHERIYGERKRARWVPPPLPEFARVGEVSMDEKGDRDEHLR